MGIVVTAAMLAGLCVFLLNPISIFQKPPSENVKTNLVVGCFLFTVGLWNAFWYGVRHADEFWGQAAIGSGLIMVVLALVILISFRRPSEVVKRRWYHWFLTAGLLVSFLLYAITLMQLNLGMEILR